jgi:hypothetical protein
MYSEIFVNARYLLRENLGPGDNVVFVDDFAGTGNHVCEAWVNDMAELLPGGPNTYLILVAASSAARQAISGSCCPNGLTGKLDPSGLHFSATTLLPEQAKPSQSIKRMALPICQFYLGLARRGSCQAALNQVCKPQVGGSIPLASSWIKP